MNTLNNNWLTEGLIDFEYKKYLLLAWLQDTSLRFSEKKIYPKLAELVEHYNNLIQFQKQKANIVSGFPKEISKLDFEKFKIEYRTEIEDAELIKEIDAIVEFALPEIEEHLSLGRELYEEVEHKVEIFPVGIMPIRNEEGYFFLSDYLKKIVNVYYYQISIFESAVEKYRGIHTRYIYSYETGFSNTYEQVKYKLIAQNKQIPNPATYAVEFKQSYPLPETMLPVAKRSLVRYISTATK
jgi:hypothetical protein